MYLQFLKLFDDRLISRNIKMSIEALFFSHIGKILMTQKLSILKDYFYIHNLRLILIRLILHFLNLSNSQILIQNFLIRQLMDFGGLDDILDDDIGYIPTSFKKQEKPKPRPATLSRQNSTQSIGSIKQTKQEELKVSPIYKKQEDNLSTFNKQSQKDRSFNSDLQPTRERRSTLFSIHKETAQQVNNNQGPTSFQDFFKNQNTLNNNLQSLSKPPLPEHKNIVPVKKLEKNSSFTHLSSPENILEQELNNSSVASRKGRPPLNRRQQNIDKVDDITNNKSENYSQSKGHSVNNETNPEKNTAQIFKIERRQQTPNIQNKQIFITPGTAPSNVVRQGLMDQSIQQLKKIFSNQLQFQKEAFETLLKQQRQSHLQEIKKLKDFHQEELNKKMQIKEFQLQKMKEFYELHLKIHNQRQYEVKQYSSIAKKLEGNIQMIEKIEKNLKETQIKDKSQRDDMKQLNLQKKQAELKKKETQLNSKQSLLQQQLCQLRNQKIQLSQQANTEKNRLYQLELELRKKQSEFQLKYKKLETKLHQEYELKFKKLQKQRQDLRIQSLQLKEQKNLIEVEKLQVINSRKLWDNQKKTYLEQLHHQKTKVLERQIQLASRTGQIQIKQQEIQMNQNDFINKLKLVQLQKKKIEIQKKNAKGQIYFNATSMAPFGIKTNGLIGTTLLNRNSQSGLNREFYSNEDYQNQGFQDGIDYKKSISQMRDQFLKSLPKF